MDPLYKAREWPSGVKKCAKTVNSGQWTVDRDIENGRQSDERTDHCTLSTVHCREGLQIKIQFEPKFT
jgi:hypothetical protein